MSSYVIRKEEYIKCAGIIAGIKTIKRDFWLYDFKHNRNSTEEDIYDAFVEMYQKNVLSVCKQYGADDVYDAKDYRAAYKESFERARDYARKKIYEASERELLVMVNDFFSCVLYQVEDAAAHDEIIYYQARVISVLVDRLIPHESSWGSIDIEDTV